MSEVEGLEFLEQHTSDKQAGPRRLTAWLGQFSVAGRL